MDVNPYAILLEDDFWNWTRSKVGKDVVKLTTFFNVTTTRGLMYISKADDTLEDVETPMLLLIPVGLVEWMLTTPCTPWELHKKIMATIADSGETAMPPATKMSLGW